MDTDHTVNRSESESESESDASTCCMVNITTV